MKALFSTVLFLCLFLMSNISNATVTISHNDCDGLRVVTDQTACYNCYFSGPAWAGNKMTYMWEVFKKTSGGWYSIKLVANESKVFELNDLEKGEYRVECYHSKIAGGGCSSVSNLLGQNVGCMGIWVSDGSTEAIEIGEPEVNANLIDISGTYFNDLVCMGDPIFLSGEHSYGEAAYHISISQVSSSGATLAWNSTGWVVGQLGTVNLLDIWKDGHPSWEFWGGYTYRVTVALSQMPCTGWKSKNYTFDAVITGCKTSNNNLHVDVELYPNPATDYINIKGYNDLEEDVLLSIFDLQGKIIKSEYIYADRVDVSYLDEGIYLIQLATANGVITSEKIVIK